MSRLWSRSTEYTTLAMGGSMPPQVEITHDAAAEDAVFTQLCESYPSVRTTFERTAWTLGIKVVSAGELRKKADRSTAVQ